MAKRLTQRIDTESPVLRVAKPRIQPTYLKKKRVRFKFLVSLHTIGFRTDAIHLPIDFHTTATADISSISYANETERDSTDAIKYLSMLPTCCPREDMSQNLIGGEKEIIRGVRGLRA